MSEKLMPPRVIPCLDVDDGRVVKGTEFLDIRDAGDPVELAKQYEAQGADELVFLDITATTERRTTMLDIVRRTAKEVFIPLTVGGGVKSESDAQALLDNGADKIAVNSAALAGPGLLSGLAARFGEQCVVLAIDAKRDVAGKWEAFASGGRVSTGRDVVSWAVEGTELGAGEILLTSIDRDGTNNGYDIELLKAVADAASVPVIASGGAGRLEDFSQAINQGGADAVLAASQFHFNRLSISELKAFLSGEGLEIRPYMSPAAEGEEPLAGICPVITIVDYGTGNRRSVEQALKRAGAQVSLTADADEIAASNGIVLPGVGAFRPAIENMRQSSLDVALKQAAGLGKPILGICLGEQLLFEESEEDGRNEGLSLLSGRVGEIDTSTRPNIGWRALRLLREDSLTKGIDSGSYFYYAHKYSAVTDGQDSIVGQSSLPGCEVVSIVSQGNIRGVQFHPEKSGPVGLRLLKNFVAICQSQI